MKRFATITVMFLLSFMLAVHPAAAATSFPDVQKSNRFHDEIHYLVDKQIISGYTNGKFQPKRSVTRGEAAIMIGRMLGMDGTKRNTQFKDVNQANGASGYIEGASERGIINGYADGTFRPNQPITRGDMASVLYRAFDLSAGAHYGFSDVGPNMTSHDAVGYLAGSAITTGYPNGTFKPLEKVTREQFSAFIARGVSPVYKQRAAMKDGYAADMTKQYVYTGLLGDHTMTYKYVEKEMAGKPLGFMWEDRNQSNGVVVHFIQSENQNSLATGGPYSFYMVDLEYPVKVGKSWTPALALNESSTITSVTKTVKTPYRTFTNAVEVTTNAGFKTYYVKGTGVVKSVNANGKVLTELKAVQ